MKGQVATVMVSSTYYDLREIRQQLARFIEDDLGCTVLISESPTFPIDPDADTIENCRQRVEQNADVLVLVIGNRYGFVDGTTGKSVTNLEYLAARAKGIPIYAFIEKSTLTLFEVWRSADPQAREALASTVQDARLFDFIEGVRTTDSVWIVGFEKSQDIIDSLRKQFAYQLHAGLELQRSIRRHPDREFLQGLRGRTFRLAVERPNAWEYRLFGSAFADQVRSAGDLRRTYELGLRFGVADHVRDSDFIAWAQARLAEARRLFEAAHVLISDTLQQAFGPPGVSGDAEEIVFVASQLGSVYREGLEWALRIRRVHCEKEDLEEIVVALADTSKELITQLEEWQHIPAKIEKALAEAPALPEGAEKPQLDFNLELKGTHLEQVIETLVRVYRCRGVHID